ncbi:solute carrier organic anion transporter family member 3A1-like [Limulus polyphemus]|uniref:Solute carrier organic anion transporter family member n=1 Tax=Limulus polyphemus TaxID=6850 RepID=A0ABM1BJJ3_LIMPO|nr:solute carrier organic anion transporter family member 3A1-like [Limulus polyphemus]XP_013783264.1 solute carrier organic anion transporter family member 3A1-like [Limulus polyphemus]XP_022251358.1 solute carrier organic anion transporter family member 3A1-like [Limulus polyphemus]XP_022251359.1 solute carrier organic anion transporter family member 3A1-like [Limulus polyphemus]
MYRWRSLFLRMKTDNKNDLDNEGIRPMSPDGENPGLNGVIVNGGHKVTAVHHEESSTRLLQAFNETGGAVEEVNCEETEKYYCELWSCRPKWLQPFANKKAFLVVFCLTSVLQGMYYTYFVSVLTTIEKRYQIQSKTAGIVMSATESGQIGGALLLTYYGGLGHRPRWIACGTLLCAIACFLCSAPHFLFSEEFFVSPSLRNDDNSSSLTVRQLHSELCHVAIQQSSTKPPSWEDSSHAIEGLTSTMSSNSSINQYVQSSDNISYPVPQAEPYWNHGGSYCDTSDAPAQYKRVTKTVLAIFFVSLLFIGIGAMAVYTLGIPYIDDNVATRESPLYFAITIGVRIFGPVFGFLLGSFCTSVYVNFPFENPTHLTSNDPQWVGAWWLGVFLVGAALILVAFPMAAFPRKLPQTPSSPNRQVAVVQTNGQSNGGMFDKHPQRKALLGNHASHEEHSNRPSARSFSQAMRRLLRNDILLCRTASSVLHILPIAGHYTFLPKYLESQFQVNPAKANMISGIAGILVMGVGIFTSGTLMRKFKPGARVVACWIALATFAYSIGMVLLMFVGCPLNIQIDMDGTGEIASSTGTNCNETCSCRSGVFAPVCGADGVTYLSPCLAGCTGVSAEFHEEYMYSDCQCLGTNMTATNGYCPLQCDSLVWYTIIFSLFILIHSTSEVGSMLLTLRCVEPEDKAMALGLISFAIGLFGNVPCPIIYGAVVDSACLFWEDNCGEPGACRVYEPAKFRMYFHGITAIIMFSAFLMDALVWYKSNSIQFHVDEENDQPEEIVPVNVIYCTQFETSV